MPQYSFFFRHRLPTKTIVIVISVLILTLLTVLPISMLFLKGWDPTKLIDLFLIPAYRKALVDTLLYALGSTAFALVFGIFFAWLFDRTNTPVKKAFEVMIILPFLIQPMVISLAWIILLGPRGWIVQIFEQMPLGESFTLGNIYGLGGMIFVTGVFYTPLIFFYVSSALKSVDPSMEEASTMLGARTLRTVIKITLPLIGPSIFAGAILTFTNVLGWFSVPILLGRPRGIYTLTSMLYEKINTYPADYPFATSIAVLLLIFSVIGVVSQYAILGVGRKKFFTVFGRAARARSVIDLGKWKFATCAVCMGFFAICIFLPLAAIAFASLLKIPSFENVVSGQFTLESYKMVLIEYPLTLRAIRNSLILGTVGATICVFMTFGISYFVQRMKAKGRVFLDSFLMLPMAIPGMALGIGMLWAWIGTPLYGTLWILLVAYITLFSPFGSRASISTLEQVHEELEEASWVCGASWFHTVRKVILPLLKQGLLAAWIIIFINMLIELSSSILLYTYGYETMSVALLNLWFDGTYSWAASLAVVQVIIIFCAFLIFRKVARVDVGKIVA